MAASALRIGDAAVYQCHLLVCVAADIALVGDYDDRMPVGVQLGEQFQHRCPGRFIQITGRLVRH